MTAGGHSATTLGRRPVRLEHCLSLTLSGVEKGGSVLAIAHESDGDSGPRLAPGPGLVLSVTVLSLLGAVFEN